MRASAISARRPARRSISSTGSDDSTYAHSSTTPQPVRPVEARLVYSISTVLLAALDQWRHASSIAYPQHVGLVSPRLEHVHCPTCRVQSCLARTCSSTSIMGGMSLPRSCRRMCTRGGGGVSRPASPSLVAVGSSSAQASA
jgi:hypothetical protein